MNPIRTLALAALALVCTPALALAVKPALGVDAKTRTEIVGEWTGANAEGVEITTVINDDGTCWVAGERVGSWEVKNNQIVVSYDDHLNHWSRFDLPVQDGALTGKSSAGSALTLKRKPDGGMFGLADPPEPAKTKGGKPNYFGSDTPDTVTETVVVPAAPPAPASTSSGPKPNYFGSTTPYAAVTAPAATPATATLDPTGSWRWHAGPNNKFGGDGSVEQRGRKVGLWKWKDEPKGVLEIQWAIGSAGGDTLILSADGKRMSGRDRSGDAMDEEKID